VVLGFGVKEPAQLAEVRDKLHGVVFGSALIKHIDGGGTAKQFMRQWL
jgi:tryptophan synthase, alpha chain (EC 4.2.1.20)